MQEFIVTISTIPLTNFAKAYNYYQCFILETFLCFQKEITKLVEESDIDCFPLIP